LNFSIERKKGNALADQEADAQARRTAIALVVFTVTLFVPEPLRHIAAAHRYNTQKPTAAKSHSQRTNKKMRL